MGISPVYAAHVESWLRELNAALPGHRLGDLNRDLRAAYMCAHGKLSEIQPGGFARIPNFS